MTKIAAILLGFLVLLPASKSPDDVSGLGVSVVPTSEEPVGGYFIHFFTILNGKKVSLGTDPAVYQPLPNGKPTVFYITSPPVEVWAEKEMRLFAEPRPALPNGEVPKVSLDIMSVEILYND